MLSVHYIINQNNIYNNVNINDLQKFPKQLTTHNSQLTTHNSQLTTHNSQLTTHNSYSIRTCTYLSSLTCA
jgi:hypothetical protein